MTWLAGGPGPGADACDAMHHAGEEPGVAGRAGEGGVLKAGGT